MPAFHIEITNPTDRAGYAYTVHRGEPSRDALSPYLVELIGPVDATNRADAIASFLLAGTRAARELADIKLAAKQRSDALRRPYRLSYTSAGGTTGNDSVRELATAVRRFRNAVRSRRFRAPAAASVWITDTRTGCELARWTGSGMPGEPGQVTLSDALTEAGFTLEDLEPEDLELS